MEREGGAREIRVPIVGEGTYHPGASRKRRIRIRPRRGRWTSRQGGDGRRPTRTRRLTRPYLSHHSAGLSRNPAGHIQTHQSPMKYLTPLVVATASILTLAACEKPAADTLTEKTE